MIDMTDPQYAFPDYPVRPTGLRIFNDAGVDITDAMTEEALRKYPPRRHSIARKDGGTVASFSIPAGVSTETAVAEFHRMQRRVAFGHSRKIVNIDGMPGPKYRFDPDKVVWIPITKGLMRRRLVWALKVVHSYLVMWKNIAWRATFGRQAVEWKLLREWGV